MGVASMYPHAPPGFVPDQFQIDAHLGHPGTEFTHQYHPGIVRYGHAAPEGDTTDDGKGWKHGYENPDSPHDDAKAYPWYFKAAPHDVSGKVLMHLPYFGEPEFHQFNHFGHVLGPHG